MNGHESETDGRVRLVYHADAKDRAKPDPRPRPVVAILREGRGRAAMLVQLNTPTVEFDLVQPLPACSVA